MENETTELSGKTPALISWMQVIGLIVLVISRLAFPQISWLFYLAAALLLFSYLLRMYFDWKHGQKRSFWFRLILLLIALVIAFMWSSGFGERG